MVQDLEAPDERVEPVGVHHERDVDARDELPHERLGAGRAPDARPEHDRVGPPDGPQRRLERLGAQRAVLLGQPTTIASSSLRASDGSSPAGAATCT